MKRAIFTLLLLLPRWSLADCAECHTAYKAKDVLKSKDNVSACQGELKRAVDEIIYIEGRFATLNRLSMRLANKEVGYGGIEKKMEKAKESYDSFLETKVVSLEEPVKNKGKVCENLRRAYLAVNDARDELKKRHIFGTIVLGSLVILFFGLCGYLKIVLGLSGREGAAVWEYDPKRDDEPYKKMAGRVSWPAVKPKAEED